MPTLIEPVRLDDGLDIPDTPLFLMLWENKRLHRMVRRTLFSKGVPLVDLDDQEQEVWMKFWASNFHVNKEDISDAPKIANKFLQRVVIGVAGDYLDYWHAAKRNSSRLVSLNGMEQTDRENGTSFYDRAVNAARVKNYVAERENDKPVKFATCCPKEKNFAKGVCQRCYNRNYGKKLTGEKLEAFKQKRREATARYNAKVKAENNIDDGTLG